MPNAYGLCLDCGNPLFRQELATHRCLSCWRSDVDDFVDMIKLGLIGLRTPGVTVQKLHTK